MANDNNRILVVDDEAVIRELLTDILVDEGFEVSEADSGVAAVEVLKSDGNFVLLFTDIMMPKMDGIELIRAARDLSPHMIPIVMTGYATLETARAAVKEGAYDYVLKPFSLSEIKLAVSNALERHRLIGDNARLLELTGLFNISEEIATIHDEKRLLDFILKASLERVGARRGSILLTSPQGDLLEVAASVGLPKDQESATVELDSSISGWVARNMEPLCVDDIDGVPELARFARRLKRSSFVSIPLERKGEDGARLRNNPRNVRAVAVLNVSEKQGRDRFTDGDMKTLSIIANHGASAISNVKLIQDLEQAHLTTLQSMARVLEAKDTYTHGHSERVRNYSVFASIRLGLSEHEIHVMRLGAMLHDVGKIGVSDAILNKVDRLEKDEWQRIKLHPVIGYDILEPVKFLRAEHLKLVRSHHERLDGKGYPDGLSADEQDMMIRIIAVADTYDAMSGDRAYRKALSNETIIQELERCSGSSLDADVCKLFVDTIHDGTINRYATHEPDVDDE